MEKIQKIKNQSNKQNLIFFTIYRSIVVTNFSTSTMPEVLKLYFESKKRSNGGEIESVDSLLNEVFIVFKNAEGYFFVNPKPVIIYDNFYKLPTPFVFTYKFLIKKSVSL